MISSTASPMRCSTSATTIRKTFSITWPAHMSASSPPRRRTPSLRSSPIRACAPRDTKDNAPAVIHFDIVPGNTLDVQVASKGGGSENKSKFVMLNPSDSLEDWVLKTVPEMGSGWCPPGILGIGVGGTAAKAKLVAEE